jgi:hypothetical protein
VNPLGRNALAAAGFAAGLAAVAELPVAGLARAAAMLALPCLLLRFLRREHDRLGGDDRNRRRRRH